MIINCKTLDLPHYLLNRERFFFSVGQRNTDTVKKNLHCILICEDMFFQNAFIFLNVAV